MKNLSNVQELDMTICTHILYFFLKYVNYILGQLTDTSANSGHGHGVKRKLWDDYYHNMKNIENISALNKNELGVNVLPPKRCASEADIV